MLEDDPARLTAMREALVAVAKRVGASEFRCIVWASAHDFIEHAQSLLPLAAVVSLDHDLVTLPDGTDPGDGLDVAKFLAAQPVVPPIIVHSSNGARAAMMLGELELAGKACARVVPIGEDWIQRDWADEVATAFVMRSNAKTCSDPTVPPGESDEADVARILRRDFRGEAFALAEVILACYDDREPHRVRLAMLKLANGRLRQLEEVQEIARLDYRDVIMLAECRRQSAFWTAAPGADDAEFAAQREQAEHEDLLEYLKWLARP